MALLYRAANQMWRWMLSVRECKRTIAKHIWSRREWNRLICTSAESISQTCCQKLLPRPGPSCMTSGWMGPRRPCCWKSSGFHPCSTPHKSHRQPQVRTSYNAATTAIGSRPPQCYGPSAACGAAAMSHWQPLWVDGVKASARRGPSGAALPQAGVEQRIAGADMHPAAHAASHARPIQVLQASS